MSKFYRYFNKRKCDIGELPDTVLIESFMGCNLRCRMCPVPDSRKNMNGRTSCSMSFDTYRSVIDQVSDRRRKIRLNQLGEPLLNQQIVDFVAYASAKGHHIGLTTNGSLLNADLSARLIQAGLNEIVFSFDGYQKKIYEKIRLGADYDRVLANIMEFSHISGLKGSCTVRVDCIVSDLTYTDLDRIKSFWQRRNITVSFIPLDDWAGKLPLPAEYGKRRSIADAKSHRYPCHLLWTALVISAEGRVIYCCHDYKQLSNLPLVSEKPLLEIWNTRVRDMRAKQVQGVIDAEPCRGCDAWMALPESFDMLQVFKDRVKAKINHLRGKK